MNQLAAKNGQRVRVRLDGAVAAIAQKAAQLANRTLPAEINLALRCHYAWQETMKYKPKVRK